jgi:signal transduction histidine kinase/CheY-like chemotaxis protein
VYGREVREEALRADAERLEAEVTQRTQELTRRTEQLFQARKMEAIGLLAGGVAHDFNNLLTVILGRSGLLRSRIGSEDPLRRHVDLIEETSKRASALTRQLLAFSRRQPFHARLVDLNAVVRDMEPMLRRLIGEDVRLQTTLLATPAWVRADQSQLEQVVLNLVVNARDAMPGGGGVVIETAPAELDEAYARDHPGARPGHYLRLSVRDTGIGMDPEIQSHIFEPFFTTKPVGRGTGLGLATVYGIVKQSEAFIWVESARARGTAFHIYFPPAPGSVAPDPPPRAEPASLKGTETVLVVEDSPQLRELIEEILRVRGYRILVAEHGDGALELARRHDGPIHLLLTDVIMPGLNGRELADRLSTERPEMKVLFASGYTADVLVRYGVAGETSYIQKPFSPDVLSRKVREVLDHPAASGVRRDP